MAAAFGSGEVQDSLEQPEAGVCEELAHHRLKEADLTGHQRHGVCWVVGQAGGSAGGV